MLKNSRRWSSAVVLGALLTLSLSCTKKTSVDAAKQKLAGTLQSAPADKESREGQLKRYRGQFKFLSTQYKAEFFKNKAIPEMAAAAGGDAGGTAKREVEESDIFKIEGNLVYLLNDYRGIQVVSYDDGPEDDDGPQKPKLVARVAPSGNYPKDMFYDKAKKRIFIVENNYFTADDYDYRNRGSRILSYDFESPERPKLTEAPVAIDGEVVAVQRVGDVLYVAAAKFPSDNSYDNVTGMVQSFALYGEKGIEARSPQQLAYPLAYSWRQEPMSIAEIPVGKDKAGKDLFKYYVIAKLSKSYWSGGLANNFVEVVDITDPAGAVKPLMVVTAKGSLNEKSQSFIKDNTLVVVSNFRLATDNRNTLHIAVESFNLPDAKPKTISAKEAKKRQLTIEIETDKLADPRAKYEKEQALLADAKTGLKGVFVRTTVRERRPWENEPSETILSKLAPDVMLTLDPDEVGEPSIQDVRVSGNRAYIFWVPPSEVDPLDIVDISTPDKSLNYLGRTKFRGFVERSFPVRYKDSEYIVSLGRVIPEVNNPFRRRLPQVRIFEIPKNLEELEGDEREAKRVASYDMPAGDTSINFSGPDKEISLQMVGEGKGVIMFPFTSWQEGARGAGAKIVGIDLNLDKKKMISEASLFARNMDWIRRVFSNPNNGLSHTFSEKSLGAFTVADGAAKMLSVLELARDIKGYVSLNGVGVQIIEAYSYDSEDNAVEEGTVAGQEGKYTVSLRLVDPGKADSELPQVLKSATVLMPFRQYIVGKDGALYLVGTNYRYEKDGEGENERYQRFLDVSVARAVVTKDNVTVSEVAKTSLPVEYHFRPWHWGGGMGMRGGMMPYFLPFYEDVTIVELPSGEIAINASGAIRLVRVDGERLQVETVKTEGCREKAQNLGLNVVSGKLLASFMIPEGDVEGQEGLEYQRQFVAKASVEAGALKCSEVTNIPGEARFMPADNHLVSEETFITNKLVLKNEKGEVIQNRQLQQTSLFSLELKDGVATLMHDYDPSGVPASNMKQVGTKLVFLESENQNDGNFYRGNGQLSILSFNQFFFEKDPFALPLDFNPHSVVSIVDEPDGAKGDKLLLVTSYRKGAVLGLNLDTPGSLTLKKVTKLNERFEKGEASDSFSLLGGSGWSYGRVQSVNFTPAQRSFDFAEGLFGVEQVVVEK